MAGWRLEIATGRRGGLEPGVPPVNNTPPVISGTPTVGSTLTCSPGSWTGVLAYSYQWQRNSVDIANATQNTYKLVTADATTSVRCVVTATNPSGSTSADSNALTIAAAPQPPVNTALPVITGSVTVGSTLTCSNGNWNPAATSYAFQWKRNGTNIPGADLNTYTLAPVDVGTSIACDVSASNAGGTTTVTADAVSIPAAPINTTPPVVTPSGTVTEGTVLTTNNGVWANNPDTHTYQWLRNGSNIAGQTGTTYATGAADVDTAIRCRVTAANVAGSANALSNIVDVVEAPVGGAAWLPTDLGPNLAGWWDAQDASTIVYGVEPAVAQWSDKSGLGRHMAMGTAANQPTYNATILNGKPALVFDGTSPSTLRGAIPVNTFASGFSFIQFLAQWSRGPAGNCGPFVRTVNFQARPFARGDNGATLYNNVNFSGLLNFRGGFPLIPSLFDMEYDNASKAYTERIDAEVNTTQTVTFTVGFDDSANTGVQMGAYGDNSNPMKGNIGETVVAPVLSLADRQKLEGYLAWHWRSTYYVPLPSSHPYFLGPPDVNGGVIPQPSEFVRFMNYASADAVSGASATTKPIDTTGATLIVVAMGLYGAGTSVVTDNYGNTWTSIHHSNNYTTISVCYCINPVTGPAHTFTSAAVGNGFSVLAQAFITNKSLAFFQDTYALAMSPGAITTPSPAMLFSAYMTDPRVQATGIDQGYTFTNYASGSGAAWLVQPTPQTVNPTWGVSGVRIASVQLAFVEA